MPSQRVVGVCPVVGSTPLSRTEGVFDEGFCPRGNGKQWRCDTSRACPLMNPESPSLCAVARRGWLRPSEGCSCPRSAPWAAGVLRMVGVVDPVGELGVGRREGGVEDLAIGGVRQHSLRTFRAVQNGKAETFSRAQQAEWAHSQPFTTNADGAEALCPMVGRLQH